MWKLYMKLALAGNESRFDMARSACATPEQQDKVRTTFTFIRCPCSRRESDHASLRSA